MRINQGLTFIIMSIILFILDALKSWDLLIPASFLMGLGIARLNYYWGSNGDSNPAKEEVKVEV